MMNAGDPRVYLDRGFAWEKLNTYQKALSDYNRAVELDPQNPKAYHARGFINGKMEYYEQSIRDFTMAIQLDPRSLPGLVPEET